MSSLKSTRKRSPHDFIFKQELGHGSYSTVYKAIDRNNVGHIYAIKVCSKAHIIKENKVKYVTIEKNTLNLLARACHPGIVKLYFTFHDEENLYFVLDYASHGELLQLLHKMGKFSESWSRHFACQLIDSIEFIHSKGIIHRDLKPENLLLNSYGRLMITDFGTATTPFKEEQQKPGEEEEYSNCSSFVGTAEYVSPELLLSNKCDFASDVWALGCIIYQFITGVPPFRGKNELQTFEKIASLDYPWNSARFSSSTINPLIISLVKRILVLDPSERLSLSDMKSDGWFEKIDWNNKDMIWRGIWQIPESPNGFPPRHNILSNKPLHIIDTPIRSIPITKQKKKKPTKVSNTTSSIVEWRRKLGISQLQSQLQSQSQSQLPSQLSPRIGMNATSEASLSVQQLPQQTMVPQLACTPQPAMTSHQARTSQPAIVLQPVRPPQPATGSQPARTPQPVIPSSSTVVPSVQRSSSQPVLTVKTHDTTLSRPFTNPTDSHSSGGKNGSYSPQRPNSIVLKQDCVNIYEIPFQAEGPQMSLQSYNKIDNDIITDLVSECKNELKAPSKIPRLLTLFKDGTLSYKSDGFSKHIVNIGDSDLSMYDFEFYEKNNKGFLILEKYRYKIWFISLPTVPATVPIGPIINRNENWVDCFFRARQMLDEQAIVGKLKNIDLAESHRIVRSPSTIESPTINTTKETTKTTKPRTSKKKNQFSNRSVSSNGGSERRRVPSSPSSGAYSKNTAPKASPQHLLSPTLSSPIANFTKHNAPRASPPPLPVSSPTSPHLPPYTMKKYAVPSNMVISSSRYEVLSALKQTTGTDVASSGASAAFKSLQKKR